MGTEVVQEAKDVDWEALRRPPEVDPVTFEILRHKLEAINEEQSIALKAVSCSPIVTEASDFNNGLYTAEGDMVSMGPQVVFHAGCLTKVIRSVLADCSERPGIAAGDVFAVNDPHKGAVHHPDMSIVAPIFADGRLVAWTGATAHLVDVGGMAVGSIAVKAKEKWQEGLMLPPVKIVEAGVVRQDVWNVIMNATRQPEMVGLDLKGLIAANVVGRRRFAELVDSYGLDTVLAVVAEMIRSSERRFRERLLELPDGEFCAQGFLDHDGHDNRLYRTKIVLRKAGGSLSFDFSQSSPQAPGIINCTDSILPGAVFGGLAPLLAYDIPWNQGILNAVEIVAPEGLVCNAVSPAPTGSATIGEGWVVVNTTVAVVSKLVAVHPDYARRAQGVTHGTFAALMLGDRNQHGEPFGTQLMDAQLGGGGATAVGDGIDQSGGFVTPVPNIPNVETNELHGPMLYLFRKFVTDSGGDGQQRGGRAAAVAFVPYGVDRLRCSFSTHGVEAPSSTGAFGGFPGRGNRQAIVRHSDALERLRQARLDAGAANGDLPLPFGAIAGEPVRLGAKVEEFELYAGDVWQYAFQGGGGFGDPLLRPPELIVTDVAAGAVSLERAEAVYGVVPSNGGYDAAATEQRRLQLRRERLARAAAPSRPVSEAPPPGPAAARRPVGPQLFVRIDGTAAEVECGCGFRFGPAAENWKFAAASLPHDPCPVAALHPDLEIVDYLCPGCGVIHAVEVLERGSDPPQDMRLTPGGLALLAGAA
jgi:N-methylhydantoinase B